MAATVILVEAQPRRASDGVAGTVRLAGGGAKFPYDYGGAHWWGGITSLPRSIGSLDFEGDQPGGGGVSQALALEWAPGTNDALDTLASLIWTDAPIAVRIGPENGDRALPPIVTGGKVLDASAESGVLRIALADDTADLKRPLLVDRFTGQGGIEGPIEWDGMLKPRAWGRCFNVVGRPIDTANNIWCFADPTRPWHAIDEVRDMGVATEQLGVLGWQGSAAATFAALQAAAAPAGGGIACPSIACVKWWTEPSGDLRADIRGESAGGYVESAPDIVARIVAARSALGFAPGTIAAAIAARPMPFGYFEDQETVSAADAISEILGDVSISWPVVDGAIHLRPWDWTPPVIEAVSVDVRRTKLHKPVGTRRLGYRRNQAPMARGDLAAIVLSRDVVYEDGTPLDALRPAAPGATPGATIGDNVWNLETGAPFPPDALITLMGTSASFLGQGSLATLSQLANGSPYLTGFGALSALPGLHFGSPYLLESDGGGSATLSAFKTALGTAAAFINQGALSTKNTIATDFDLSGSVALRLLGSPADPNYLNADRMAWSTGGTVQAWKPGEPGANITETRSAASFLGQGALSTQNSLANGSSYLTGFGQLSGINEISFGSSYLRETTGGALATLSVFKTALGTAASIAGQGPGATAEGYKILNSRSQGNVVRVALPLGGSLSADGFSVAGPCLIVLPLAFTGQGDAMIRFLVDFFEYATNRLRTFEISGYLYQGVSWVNCSARMIGNSTASLPVRFGRVQAGGVVRWAVQLGTAGDILSYPAVSVRDVQVSYANVSVEKWEAGWNIYFGVSAGNFDYTDNEPRAGDAVFGVNALESWGGGVATLPNFKTGLGTAAAFLGQGYLATRDRVGLNAGPGGLTNAAGTAWLGDAQVITAQGTAASIASQGPGATALARQVLNNISDQGIVTVRRPEGAGYSGGAAVYGRLTVLLPAIRYYAMVKFTVDVFDYALGQSVSYFVSGYVYNGLGERQWLNQSAQFIGPHGRSFTVLFGYHPGTEIPSIRIGTDDTLWQYPQVSIRDVQVGYSAPAPSTWESGWVIGFNAGNPENAISVGRPRASDAIFGEGVFEQAGGGIATLPNFKTGLGTASAITGQSAWATETTVLPAKLLNIEAGADVTANSVPIIEPPGGQTINADYQGTPLSGQFPRTLQTVRRRGATNVSSSSAWQYTGLNCNLTAGTNGAVTVNSMSGNTAAVIISSLRDGVLLEAVVPFTKINAAPPQGGGSGATSFTASISIPISDTTYDSTPQILATGTMAANGSGQVRLSLSAEYWPSPQISNNSAGDLLGYKWQRSTDGTTWTDLGSESFGSESRVEATGGEVGIPTVGDSFPGTIYTSEIFGGMTAGATYQFRAIARRGASNNSSQANVSGSASGGQS